MASSSQLRTGIQVVLAIVIVVLGYILYESITDPYQQIQQQERLTELTRERMDNIRTALVRFESQNDSFPDSLSHLMEYLRQDSLVQTKADSIFGPGLVLDSLLYSPRSGNSFEYTVNDTGRVQTYLLKDPDSNDQIGTLSGDVTQTNAANWE